MRDAAQLELLHTFAIGYRAEYEALPYESDESSVRFFLNNGMFESVDAEILYCVIRHFRPRTIIEVGSGYSSLLAAHAAQRNRDDGSPCELIAIEPFPPHWLKAGLNGLTRLIEAPIEDVPISEFLRLGPNDVFFIDSSHVIRTGGDVVREYLEILPRLHSGVLVHCHDIYLPRDYPRDLVVRDHNFWTEQYILHAFLLFNRAFEVVWAGSYMQLAYPERLASAFPSYSRGTFWPKSLWMRRVAG